jgi:hypothetical protein
MPTDPWQRIYLPNWYVGSDGNDNLASYQLAPDGVVIDGTLNYLNYRLYQKSYSGLTIGDTIPADAKQFIVSKTGTGTTLLTLTLPATRLQPVTIVNTNVTAGALIVNVIGSAGETIYNGTASGSLFVMADGGVSTFYYCNVTTPKIFVG